MPTEIQLTDEQHLVRLVLEAGVAVVGAAGPMPKNSEDMAAYMINLNRLMRCHDPRLEALDDETLTRLSNTPLELDDDDVEDDNNDDGDDDDDERASSPENPAKRITKDSLQFLLICARCWVRDKLEEYETGESSAENIVDAMPQLFELLKEAEAKEEAERLARAGGQAA
jgi:hypothetical protein